MKYTVVGQELQRLPPPIGSYGFGRVFSEAVKDSKTLQAYPACLQWSAKRRWRKRNARGDRLISTKNHPLHKLKLRGLDFNVEWILNHKGRSFLRSKSKSTCLRCRAPLVHEVTMSRAGGTANTWRNCSKLCVVSSWRFLAFQFCAVEIEKAALLCQSQKIVSKGCSQTLASKPNANVRESRCQT